MKRLLLAEFELCWMFDLNPRDVKSTGLPKVYIGNSVFYDVDDIYAWLRECGRFEPTVQLPVEPYRPDEEIPTVSALALALGLTYTNTYKMVRQGKIPSSRRDGQPVFRVRDLKAWIAERKKKPRRVRK